MLKKCSHCLIQEDRTNFIIVGSDGICNLCKSKEKTKVMSFEERKKIFEEMIYKVKGKYNYDGLIMLSGGKDSTYLALRLKRDYNLNLLALTIDNGFEYEDTFMTSKSVSTQLGIPLVTFKPSFKDVISYYKFLFTDKKLYKDDCSQICYLCGVYLKKVASDFAKAFNIPFVFTGYDPEQINVYGEAESIETDPKRIMYQRNLSNKLTIMMDDIQKYVKSIGREDLLPFFQMPDASFINYYQYFEYKPVEFMEVVKKELGWRPCKKFEHNYITSGCKLGIVLLYLAKLNGKQTYIEKGYSSLIRDGVIDRSFIEEKYADSDNLEEIKTILNNLEIEPEVREYLLQTMIEKK